MRLRGYHIRGSKDIEDTNLEFKDSDGNILNIVMLFGKNGSGKSYIMSSIARGWSSSVLSGGSTELPYVADMLRIDYEVGREICGVHIRRGRLDKSATLAKAADVSVGDKPHVKNGIVYYSAERTGVTRSTVRRGSQLSESVCSVFPVVYDLHMRDVRDSVILVDDWDRGLDDESRKSFYTHLTRHALGKGNQLVLASSTFPAEWIPSESVVKLRSRTDPTQRSMSLLSQVEKFEEDKKRLLKDE